MELRVKPIVAFLRKVTIEGIADSLLERYEAQVGPILAPPVPVEFIVEDFLGYTVIPEYLDGDALAFIDPNERIICWNLNRSDYFDTIGPEFTLAHEIGHPELGHFEEAAIQLALGLPDEPRRLLHRAYPSGKDGRREYQAEYFASCLTIPKKLILPAAQKRNLYRSPSWSSIYELARRFNVSATAMTIRLKGLGLIYPDGKKLYTNKQEAHGQRRLF
jgi:Zn-dependent peptidase ImmA (M78 family)